MKGDERKLLDLLKKTTIGVPCKSCVTQSIDCIGMNEKRAVYILQKWSDKGWYSYGVNVFCGWLTLDGFKA